MTARVAEHYAVGPFDDQWSYESAGPSGPQGTTAMTVVAVAQTLAYGANASSIIFANSVWGFTVDSSGLVSFQMEDSVGTKIASLTTPLPLGGPAVLCGSYDGSNVRIRGLGETATTPAAGGADTSGATQTLIGGLAAFGGLSIGDSVVLGCAITEQRSQSLAELVALEAAVQDNIRHGRDLDAGLATFTPESYFDAADLAADLSTWSDRYGATGDLSRNGTPELWSVKGRVAA